MNLTVLCTCPDDASASKLASSLVEEQLAACVSRMPVASTYRWQGEVCNDHEVLLIIKTSRARFAALEARVLALHPYKVPELIALPVETGHTPYLDWLTGSVSPRTET